MANTPIAYVIFNRPSHTRETFATIRAQQPAKLFFIADGLRPEHPTDAERCREVREVVEEIDWPCEVGCNYADVNLDVEGGFIKRSTRFNQRNHTNPTAYTSLISDASKP